MIDKVDLERMYWQQQLSVVDIEKRTGRGKSSIHRDLIAYGIPRRSYHEAYRVRDAQGKCWHNHPDLTMNPNLAYIAGVCYGDGYLRRIASGRGKCLIGLNVSSEVFARSFATAVRQLGLICNIYKPSFTPDARHKSQMYRATFHSVKFYQWFKGLTFDQVDKLLSTTEERRAFICGFYESEGSCYRRKESSAYSIAISNTKEDLTRFVHALLLKEDFEFHIHGPYDLKNPKWKPVYQLTLYKQSEVLRFLNWLNPCVKIPN